MRYPVERLGIDPAAISSSTDWVRFLHQNGSVEYVEERQ